MIDDVQPAQDVLPQAISIACEYARLPQKTFASIKSQMRASALETINEAIKNKSDPTRAGWFSDETKPAISALLNTIMV